jgi:ATP-dependent DNA helicase RecG
MGLAKASTISLQTPIPSLRGVGSERQGQLDRLGLRTLGDLFFHQPRRYEDRRRVSSIAQLTLGESSTVRGRVVAAGVKTWRKGTKSIAEVILEDGTGRLHCRWWNLPFMQSYFKTGDEVLVFGKVVSVRPRTIDHPETEMIDPETDFSIHMNRIAPVYPLTEGLPQRWLRAFMWRALEEFGHLIPEPEPCLAPPEMMRRPEAVRAIHFPAERQDAERGRERLALDEFIQLQLSIQGRRVKLQSTARAYPCGGNNRLIKKFLAELGFTLTEAQKKVLREIRADLSGPHPMRRLLQGDVGSGKTAVAACAALMAVESGFNIALMAPTEILAEQHFRSFRHWCGPLGVSVELQTGSHKTADSNQPDLEFARGRLSQAQSTEGSIASPHPERAPSIFIGTHALIEEAFAPQNLGLVIIDEQHKFGVAQREKLVRKGIYPHLLVMTATPIPRTLGLTLYGDLDISVIDQLPPGRGEIKTFVRGPDKLPKIIEFIRGKMAEGRQAYVVYPRIEEGELRTGLKAVTQEFDKISKALAPYRVGLLHGRLKSEEKESVMRAFVAGQLNALLATSVIEVGVDVPNATVMLIENAEQFGLAQLHQLRGRIGRGKHESYCILAGEARTDEARQRLRVLEATTDGFRIAEEDLRLRGPGEFLGAAQSGLPPFRFGDLTRDRELIDQARNLVADYLRREKNPPRKGVPA